MPCSDLPHDIRSHGTAWHATPCRAVLMPCRAHAVPCSCHTMACHAILWYGACHGMPSPEVPPTTLPPLPPLRRATFTLAQLLLRAPCCPLALATRFGHQPAARTLLAAAQHGGGRGAQVERQVDEALACWPSSSELAVSEPRKLLLLCLSSLQACLGRPWGCACAPMPDLHAAPLACRVPDCLRASHRSSSTPAHRRRWACCAACS